MNTEIIKFNATDGVILDGAIKKCENKTDKVLIQIHGMTSNCFKNRDDVIAKEVEKLNIDTICFNNRGSEIIRYCKKTNGEKIIQGTAYEDVKEGYYDISGAIEYAVNLGYKEIYLQGHSLGCTKTVYSYNKMKKENNKYLEYIKGIILLSLVDIPDMMKTFTPEEYIEYANKKESENSLLELMPNGSTLHIMSIKTFLRYVKYYEEIDFAKYDDANYDFEELNNISVPLFMRWGNNNELIKQDAKELSNMLKNKIKNELADINYIDDANHSYKGKEEILAEEISLFLRKITE